MTKKKEDDMDMIAECIALVRGTRNRRNRHQQSRNSRQTGAPATPAEPAEHQQNRRATPAEPEQPADTVTSAKSNQALVAKQQIIKLPQIVEDFRFWTVARKYAFAKSKINIREAIPENIDGSNTQDVKTDLENAKADTKKLQKKKRK